MTRHGSISSTGRNLSITVVSSTTPAPPWCFTITSKCHKIHFLYPMMLIFNLGVIAIMAGCGFFYNSLGLLSHSLHMCLNWLLIFVLTICVFKNWTRTKCYEPKFTTNAHRFNIFIGALMLISSIALISASIWNILYPPKIKFLIDHVCVPVPSFFLSMLNIYIVAYDYDAEKVDENLMNEQSKAGYKNIEIDFLHIKSAALGSLLTIVISSVGHVFELVLADAVISITNAVLMFACAVYLVMSSYTSVVEQKQMESNLEEGRLGK